MGNNLVPEKRADKNGKIVIRHVKSDFVKPVKDKPSIPKPSVHTRSILQSVRLKEMDSGALTLALLSDVRLLEREGKVNYDAIFDALDAATFLHLHQTRGNRKNLPKTPYIEHPLRNTLRSLRWGCKDQSVLIATILHDTVEDCADEIVSYYLQHEAPESLSEHEKRELALGWVESNFGAETRHLVLAVSNPLGDGKDKTAQEKYDIYAAHVEDSIRGDAKAFLVKFADFVDNAVGLHHNDVEGNHAAVTRRARKYRPVVDIFEREFLNNPELRELVSEEGYASIWEHIQEAKVKLTPLSERELV